jgi:hypothetical protein
MPRWACLSCSKERPRRSGGRLTPRVGATCWLASASCRPCSSAASDASHSNRLGGRTGRPVLVVGPSKGTSTLSSWTDSSTDSSIDTMVHLSVTGTLVLGVVRSLVSLRSDSLPMPLLVVRLSRIRVPICCVSSDDRSSRVRRLRSRGGCIRKPGVQVYPSTVFGSPRMPKPSLQRRADATDTVRVA